MSSERSGSDAFGYFCMGRHLDSSHPYTSQKERLRSESEREDHSISGDRDYVP